MLHCQLARKSEAFLRVRTESEPQSVNQRERSTSDWLIIDRSFSQNENECPMSIVRPLLFHRS